jgi:signal transduction histidine kinase
VLVHDLRRFLLADPRYAPIHRFVHDVPWDIVYSLPLVSRDRTVGAIFFCYLPSQEPGDDEKVFLKAISDQAAVALENARLLSEARGKAALEERQRLARELHDSVSQALYGIALGAKTARTLLDQNPQLVADPLDYVLSLSEAGLAEMRALIFELRPESLQTEGLVAALEKQAAALRARHEIEVEASLCDEPEASLEAKETVYRIAQEALHNTVKHARASSVKIAMRCTPEGLTLDISDDGVGFDPGGDFPGHLGLRSMRERAVRLGGTLEVESAPARGARIRARIPLG